MTDGILGLTLQEVLGGSVAVPADAAAVHRRWLGRSSMVVGGVASLAVGAILGGVLEGIPVVLQPPATAAGAGSISPLHRHALGSVADTAARALAVPAAAHPHVTTPAPVTRSATSASPSPATGGAADGVGTPPVVSSVPNGSGGGSVLSEPALPVPGLGTGATSSPARSTTAGSASACSPCQAAAPVTSTLLQAVSTIPVVGGILSGVVGTVGTGTGTLGTATQGLVSNGAGLPGSSSLAGVSGSAGTAGGGLAQVARAPQQTAGTVPAVGGVISSAVSGAGTLLGGF
ncbi:MAG: hypothetical protein M0Z63_12130 [Actinomycetota bacterium]|jgi:hypothetical protein|nr:hypothetical protein [Actinomycetota bacterium]MDA8281142.1 hypothetical protein [Actinomycetota bacterium]